MHIRRCPHCKSFNVRRSRAKGFLESDALRAVMLRPYRCHDCYTRYYGFAALSKAGNRFGKSGHRPTQVSAMVLQRIGLATLVVGLLVLLANSGQAIAGLVSRGDRSLFKRPDVRLISSVAPTTTPVASMAVRRRLLCADQNAASASPIAMRDASMPLGLVVQADDAMMNGAAAPSNTPLFSGDSISVGARGAALVRFSTDNLATVSDAADVCFTGNNQAVRAEVRSGSMQVAWSGRRPFVLQTADYRIESHGPGKAEFRVAVSSDQKTALETQYGNVTVTRLGSRPADAMAQEPSTAGGALPQTDANAPTTQPIGAVVQSVATTRNGAPLSVGAKISVNDQVETGAAGSAEIQLSPLNKVFLHRNTTVRLTRPVQLVWVELKSGEVVADSQGANGTVIVTPKFYIQPASSAPSRIYVGIMADHSTYIESDAGNVRIEDIRSGQFYTLQANNTTFIPENAVGVPGLSSQPTVTATAPLPKPAQTAVVAQQNPAPKVPQPTNSQQSASRRSLIILGIAAAAGTSIAVAALAAGGSSRPPVSPSTPF